ncbi:MAG: methyltransferase [Pseudonocardiaceae bacterium]
MTSTVPDVSTPDAIIRLGVAFCEAKALLTAVDLDLFSTLHSSPATEEEIRQRLALHGRGLSDLLHILVALGLLEKDGDRFRNTTGADRYLVRGQQGYLGAFLWGANQNIYPAWGKLTTALRTGKPQHGDNFLDMINDPRQLGHFVAMMDAINQFIGPELIKAVDWSGHASVLDVGGCRGNIVGQIVKAHPGLTGHVFDLPQMEPLFSEHIADMGLTGAVRFHGGDFFRDPLPKADLVILGHVLHDWNREQRAFLFRKAREAVNPGGTLLVYDPMLDDKPGHFRNLLISLTMLLVTDGGSEYPVSEVYEYASAAGVSSVTDQPLGAWEDTLVVCRVPS